MAEQGAQNGAALGPSMRPRWSAMRRGLGPCWGAGAAEGAPRGVAQGRSMRLRMGEAWGRGGAGGGGHGVCAWGGDGERQGAGGAG